MDEEVQVKPKLAIAVDDLNGPEIAALLQRHLDLMYSITPAGSVYALDLGKLRVPEITFWNAKLDGKLVGCVALKEFGTPENRQGEIKSMHTMIEHRGQGIAHALVSQLIEEAKGRGLKNLWLETGKTEGFLLAQKLYEGFGFTQCGPFGDYAYDAHSHYMTRALAA